MKQLLSLVIAVTACNQVLYDQLYRKLVRIAIEEGATRKSMEARNKTIEFLRDLCNGQKSTYEGEKHD